MAKTYKKGVGGFDSVGLPAGDKSADGLSARYPKASLDGGVDISAGLGPAAPNPPRGSKPPHRSAQIPAQERTHKR